MRGEACFGNAEAVRPKGWESHTLSKAWAGVGLSGATRFKRDQVWPD